MSRWPLAALIVVCLAPGAAHAQSDSATATALFDSARADMKAGRYAAACPKFAESYRLVEAPGTLLNLADCEEREGKLATAWQRFVEASQRLPASDPRAALAAERAAALEPRVPRISVKLASGAPAGARVTLAGKELSGVTLGLPLPFDPGEYEVVVTAPGRRAKRSVARAIEKQTIELVVDAGEPEPAAPSATPEPGPRRAQPAGRRRSRVEPAPAPAAGGRSTLAWVALGVGALGLGTGATAAALANGARDDADAECPGRRCSPAGLAAVEDGERWAAIAWLGYGVGAVGLAVGALLFATGGEGDSARHVTPFVAVQPRAGALGFGGRF